MNDWLAFKVKGRMTAAPSVARVLDPQGPEPATTTTEATSVEKPERRDWAFFFLLVFTVLVFLRPQDAIPGLHYLHLAELSAISALVSLIGGRLGRNLPVTRINPELIGVVALGGLILVTAPFSIWFSGAIGVFTEYYGKIIVIYLLMTNVLTSPRRIERLTWLLVLPSGYLAFRAVFDFARGVQLTESGGRLHGAVGGIFGNPNDLALNMVALLPLALFLALRDGSALRRGIAGVCALFMFGAVIASHSRGGALGLAAMAGVFGLFLLRRRPGLVFGVAITLALAAPMAPASYWHRLASITDQSQDDTGSRETRRTLLRESYQAFLENPLTGVGAGQFKNWNPRGTAATMAREPRRAAPGCRRARDRWCAHHVVSDPTRCDVRRRDTPPAPPDPGLSQSSPDGRADEAWRRAAGSTGRTRRRRLLRCALRLDGCGIGRLVCLRALRLCGIQLDVLLSPGACGGTA